MRGRAAAIAKTLVPALGLSFLWPYFRASFLSFLTVFDVHPGPVVHAAYNTYVAVFALACACAVFAAPQARRWLRARHAPLALGLCGSAGNGLLWLGAPAPLDTALCVAGCVGATGFFAGCLLGYGLAFSRQEARRVAVVAFASFGLSFLDNAALASPLPVAAAFCIGAPLVCAACMPPTAADEAPSAAEGPSRAHGLLAPAPSPSATALVALVVLLALFCLTGNVVRGLTNPWFANSGPTLRSLYMSAANLVFALVSIALLWRGVDVRKVLFWNWTACMALFFAGLLGLSLAGGTLASVGSDVATVSRVCFTLLMFLFALEAQRWTSAGTVRLLGLFLLLPEALSAFVRHIVVPPLLASTGMEPLAAASYAGMAIVLVLIVAIVVVLGNLLLRQVEPRAEEAAFPAASPIGATDAALQAPSPDARGAALARIARDFGLTAREAQTASYVSQGYSLEKTAELLGISINTVRTHMRSVYGKLAIHSRQELIDLLDGRA